MDASGSRLAATAGVAPAVPAAGQVRVASPLTDLFPSGGIEPGSVLSVAGAAGSTALLMALLSALMGGQSWAAVVGMADLGVEAAAQLGVPLERLVVVPWPGPRWSQVVAVLLDAVEVVAIRPPSRCSVGEARRLAARARSRDGLLLVCPPPLGSAPAPTGGRQPLWPETVDLRLEPVASSWQGLDEGTGVLARHRVQVRVAGRRVAGRERSIDVWLPGSDGRAATINPLGDDRGVQRVGGSSSPSNSMSAGRRVGS